MKALTTFFSVIAIFISSINSLSAVILPPYSGYSVSASGNFLMWGQELSDNNKGKAFIKHSVTFQEWQLTANNGRSGDRFGHSVSIDGNWAIIGADGDDTVGAEAGAAYIFRFDGENWVQQQKLVGLDTARDDGFGCSVCINGNFAIVGAYGNNGKGAAYIFYYDGTRWLQHSKITADDGVVNDLFGWSVSISGNYVVVGDPFNDLIDGVIDDSGAAYVFYYNGTNWVQQAKLIASDPEKFDRFGWSVSISSDYVIVGSFLNDDFGLDCGSAYIFQRNGTNWEQVQKLTAYDPNLRNWFGYSVSIDGNYAFVGSPLDNYKDIDSGSVFMYEYDGTKWALRGKLTGTSAGFETQFGLYVCTKSSKIIMGGTGTASWLLSIPSIEPIQDTPEAGSAFNFRINVNVPFDVEPVTLYYRQGAKSVFNSIPFTLENGTYKNGVWTATIPADQITTRGIEYYIVAPERDRDRNIYYYGTMNEPYFLPVHGNITINLRTTIAKKPNVWNIIAPSVITDNKSVVQNFSSLGVFGLNWIAWRWNTLANRWEVPQNYRIFPVSSNPFDVSIGWWVMAFGDGSVRSVNIAGMSVDPQKPYSIALKAGWNNVANPFDFPVAWSDNTIRIEYDDQQVTPTQSKANFWVDNRTFWYDYTTNQYNIMASNQNPPYPMPPKVGFWIYSLVNDAKLIICPIESASASPPSPLVYNEEKTIWKVSLSLETNEGNDSVEAIVSDKNCTGISHIKPPSMPFITSRISIVDPNDDIELSKGINLAKEQILWHIKIDISSFGHLSWKMENVPFDYNLILEDSSTGKVYDLKRVNSIDISSGNYAHYFTLKAFKQDIPSKTRVLPNYPNPFNPETWIPFELSEPANVTIKIFSLDGQLVKTLNLGNKPAGRYTTRDRSAYWDGRNEFGEYVSSGVYFYITKIGNVELVHKMTVIK